MKGVTFMSKFIDEKQNAEIVEFILEHADGFAAFGTNLFVGVLILTMCSMVFQSINRQKQEKKKEKELQDLIRSFIECDFEKMDLRIQKTKAD